MYIAKGVSPMSKAKQQRRKEIKAELALGQRRYVIMRGVVGWGLPTYLLYLLISIAVQSLFQGLTFIEAVKSLFPFTIIFGLLVFAVTGFFMGRSRWKQLLKEAGGKYQDKKAK